MTPHAITASGFPGSVRGIVRAIVIFVVSVGLGVSPAFASGVERRDPLGVVLVAQKAHGLPNPASDGSTIYDGDRLQTPGDGTLQTRLGTAQLVLRENSSVIVHAAAYGFSAELESGTILVSGARQNFQVLADGATVRPLNAQPASARVIKVSATELILTSLLGTLEASVGGEVKIIEARASYKMEIDPRKSEAGPQPTTPPPGGHSHFKQILVPAIVIPTTLVVIRALESGDRL